jgi:hypothetical protein
MRRRCGSRRVSVEAEFLFTNRDHIGTGEQPLPVDPRVIDGCPIRARIDDQVAFWCLHDFGVAARHVLARNDDIAGRIPLEHE